MTDLETGAAPAAAEPTAIADVQTVESSPMERIERTLSETYDKINPPREDGKFVAKDKPGDAPASDPVAEIKDQNPVEVKVEPTQSAIDAPISWSAEMKAKFASLPPDAQSYIAQREGEAHKRISELGQQVKAFEPIRELVEPLRQASAKNGVNERDGLQRLLAANEYLDRDPAGAIKWLAEAYGIALPSASPAEGDQSDYIRSLEARVTRAERLASETHSKMSERERTENEREQSTIAEKITSFAKDKPHFEKVRRHMGALMNADESLTLDDAYDMAIHAVPDIRNSLLAEKQKAEAEKAEKERAEKAKEAKRMGSLNVKSNSASPAKKGSWEDTLRAVGDRIAG